MRREEVLSRISIYTAITGVLFGFFSKVLPQVSAGPLSYIPLLAVFSAFCYVKGDGGYWSPNTVRRLIVGAVGGMLFRLWVFVMLLGAYELGTRSAGVRREILKMNINKNPLILLHFLFQTIKSKNRTIIREEVIRLVQFLRGEKTDCSPLRSKSTLGG